MTDILDPSMYGFSQRFRRLAGVRLLALTAASVALSFATHAGNPAPAPA